MAKNRVLSTLIFVLMISSISILVSVESTTYGEGLSDTFTFQEIGQLNTQRYNHTVELLSNDQVIFIGGHQSFSGGETPASEIYDPETRELTYSGEMVYDRQWHSSTTLIGGKVLVTGGGSISAEEYDPLTGLFYPVGNMVNQRYEHVTARLQNGTVLIIGGSSGSGIYKDVELYNPQTGAFTVVGGMNESRNGHTATLLLDGTVLVTGGAGNGISRTAEIYDPSTSTFSYTGMMTENRFIHTATLLLDGRVLIVGGSNGKDVPNDILNSAEIYDPSTGIFTRVGNLNHKRMRHKAILMPHGKVLILGGNDRGDKLLDTVELYDPHIQQFTVVGSLLKAREHFAAILLRDGSVLVGGGVVDDPDGSPTPKEITTSVELVICTTCIPPEQLRLYVPSIFVPID